jgi:NADPH:quinone reductase-like Zn-dependent oxidoreductase
MKAVTLHEDGAPKVLLVADVPLPKPGPRQRVPRLVRATMSFSKNLTHHIGAIRYLICDNNVTRSAAFLG